MAVSAFRAAVRPAIRDAERQRWMRPVARCVRRARRRRGFGYGREPCRSTRAQIHARVVDRAVRWLLPRALAASGDVEGARRLVEAPSLLERSGRREARRLLGGDDPARVVARRMLERRPLSVEALAADLGELVHLALDAGAERDPILQSLRGFMHLLTEPSRLRPRLTVAVDAAREVRASADVYARLREAEPCLEAAFERTGWAVEVPVVVLFEDARVEVHAASEDAELARCVERRLGASSRRLPAPGTRARATLRLGPRPASLFARPTFDAAGPRAEPAR